MSHRPLIPWCLSLLQGFDVSFATRLGWRVPRYSFLQWPKNSLASASTCLHWPFRRSFPSKSPGGAGWPYFCVKSIVGDNKIGEKGSEENGISGLAFIIAVTSAVSMHRISYVSVSGLQKHAVQYCACHSNHTFPHTSHVGRVRGVELPCTALAVEITQDAVLLFIRRSHPQFSTGSKEVSTSI